MSIYGEQLAQKSASGKTFFFNRQEARNGTEYLCINSIYGDGMKERMVIFPSQIMEFRDGFNEAFEKFTGLKPTEVAVSEHCPECGSRPRDWGTLKSANGEMFVVFCRECREIILENVEDAYELIMKERENE